MESTKYHYYLGVKHACFMMTDDMSHESAKRLRQTITENIKDFPNVLLFNFERAKSFPKALAEAIHQTYILCSQKKIKFSLCTLSPDAKNFLQANDLLRKVKVFDDYYSWANEHHITDSRRANFNLCEIFHESVLNIVPSFSQISITPSNSYIGTKFPKISGYIGASIDVIGKRINGNFLLYIEEKFMVKTMHNLLGESIEAESPESVEGVKEITNMIFGRAKTGINNEGYEIKIEIPTILSPEKTAALQANKSYNIVLTPYLSASGNIFTAMRF